MAFDWYHLWFLVALLLYSLLLYALLNRRIDDRVIPWITRWARNGRGVTTTAILTTACASAVLFALAPPIMAELLSPKLFNTFRNLQLIAGYLPMFLFGVLAIRVQAFGARLLGDWRTAAAFVMVIAGSYVGWFVVIDPVVATADAHSVTVTTANLRFVAASLCPPAVFVLILRSALAIRQVPPLLARLSEASYTIYILHLPLAAAINLPLHALGVDRHLIYVIGVAGSAVISYGFHRGCVRHSDVLRLVLNGRIPRRSRQSDLARDLP